jgi:hypothetical protein
MARRAQAPLRLLGGVLLLVLLAVGCDPIPPGPTPPPSVTPSGIAGVVMLGPTCSAPTAADPCLAAYAARLVVFDTDGQVVGHVASGADGRFQLALPPGDYVIQPAPGGDPFPRAEAQTVTVVDGEITQLEIDYETRDRATDTGG